MTLSTLIAIPLIGALAVYFLPRTLSKVVGLGVALGTLILAIVVAAQYQTHGGMQFTETHEWMKQFGVHYALGVDGLGLLMVLLTVVLVPLVLIAEWPNMDPSTGSGTEEGAGPKVFMAWALALEGFALAVFCATDVFLFYVVFEATLIPAYFLVGSFGRSGRGRAALKFLLFQLAGGLILLAAVIGLYVASAHAGTPSYLLSDLQQLHIPTATGRWLFVGFFTAFAIKAPLFPVHTWLADTTEKATPGTSVLLVCVLDKIGTFGMLRFCLGIFPEASRWATPVVITLALISVVYGALLAIGQDDMLRLIGLTSLSHFGLITLGIFAFSSQGGSGAILYMINHGIGTAVLFLAAGYLYRRRGTYSIRELGGQEKLTPVLAGMFLVGGLATLGLPGLSPFVSEFLVLLAGFQYHWFVGAIAITAVVLSAIYVLWLYQRAFTGPVSTSSTTLKGTSTTLQGTSTTLKGTSTSLKVVEPVETSTTLKGTSTTPKVVEPVETSTTPKGTSTTLKVVEPVETKDLDARELGAVVPLVAALLVFGFFPSALLNVANPMIGDLMSHVGVSDPGPTVAVSTGTTTGELGGK